MAPQPLPGLDAAYRRATHTTVPAAPRRRHAPPAPRPPVVVPGVTVALLSGALSAVGVAAVFAAAILPQ